MHRVCLDLPEDLLGAVQRLAGKDGVSTPVWMVRTLRERIAAEDERMSVDRRRHPRIPVGLKGSIRMNGSGVTSAAGVHDVSLGGVWLSVGQPHGQEPDVTALLQRGAVFELVFSLPGGGRPVLLHCQVVRRSAGEKAHVGARLLTAEWNSLNGLHAFVERSVAAAGEVNSV